MMEEEEGEEEEEEERLCRQVDGLRAELNAMRRRCARAVAACGRTAVEEKSASVRPSASVHLAELSV